VAAWVSRRLARERLGRTSPSTKTRSLRMIVGHHLPRISSNPSPDDDHDGACRNSPNQERRFRTTEGAALKSNNVLPSESGAAARHDRIAVDPINHKPLPLAISVLHDDRVARLQWPVGRLARRRRGLNPLHARAAR
jgi:hypothetical protein